MAPRKKKATGKKVRRPEAKTNRQLLLVHLSRRPLDRVQEIDDPPNTSHIQGIAARVAMEMQALSAGAGECTEHRGEDLVKGACPRCFGLWPEKPDADVEPKKKTKRKVRKKPCQPTRS